MMHVCSRYVELVKGGYSTHSSGAPHCGNAIELSEENPLRFVREWEILIFVG